MNSNFGKSSASHRGGGGGGGGSVSFNSFDFDLGFSSNGGRSLNDQKHGSSSYSSSSPSSFSSAQTRPNTTSSPWQPNKPSWTHQPAAGPAVRPGLPSGPVSMVGDISGKSWGSAPPSRPAATVGIVNKDPNLFGDLLDSALGQGKSNVSNVPLKNAPRASAPVSSKASYSMGNLADSLPKFADGSNRASSENFASSMNNRGSKNVDRNPSLGGPSMRSSGGIGGAKVTKKDPFGSFVDFGSKEAAPNNKIRRGDDTFGDFLNAPKANTQAYPSRVNPPSSANNFTGSSSNSSSKLDNFGISEDYASQGQPPVQPTGGDPLDMFFSSPSASATTAPSATRGVGDQPFSQVDDWGLDSGFGGGGGGGIDEGVTMELEGLPPPPAGVSASAAMSKGMDNHKQGQYADAIKWLSWALILFEKATDGTLAVEVLSSRASCYKEVGEYKKAVADCTKVLERDKKNVSVLVQRALLYESMEKYKLGAEDLRAVMKLDPGNRVARSTIHRLTKMAE